MQRLRAQTMLLLMAATLTAWVAVHRSTTSDEHHSALSGQEVAVIDGDTIQLQGKIVQIYGIDAPEIGQRCDHDFKWVHCGLEAAYELRKLLSVERLPVHCQPVDGGEKDLAWVCLVGNFDLAHVLLRGGYAVTGSQTSQGYRDAERFAQQAGLGLWHSQFIPPAEWRAGKRLPGEDSSEKPDCPIKAVITDDGSHLYYVPTDSGYESIAVDPENGDRFYCSDEEARRAGWRREGENPAVE